MITAIILTFFIGTLTGYITAALMAVSSNADRAREEQEKATEQPPVIKSSSYKTTLLEAYETIDLNDFPPEVVDSDEFMVMVTNHLTAQLANELKEKVWANVNIQELKKTYHLNIWA